MSARSATSLSSDTSANPASSVADTSPNPPLSAIKVDSLVDSPQMMAEFDAMAAFRAHVREPLPTVENPTICLYDTPTSTLAFWSTNAKRFDFPSKVPQRRTGEDAMLYGITYRDLLRPQWFCRHRQHWPMIPLRVDFENHFIRQFNFTDSSLPVIRTMNGKFCLFPEVANTWREHEQLYENLCLYFDQNAYARPMTVQAITWPYQHKYDEAHHDEKTVRRRCMLALLRFREHWGMLAYVAFGTNWESRLEKATEEQRKMGVHPALIQDLKKCGILDKDTPRVGTFVDVDDAGYPFPIARATRFRSPVWFLFGRVEYLPHSQFRLIARYHHQNQNHLNPNPDTNRLSIRLRDIIRDLVRQDETTAASTSSEPIVFDLSQSPLGNHSPLGDDSPYWDAAALQAVVQDSPTSPTVAPSSPSPSDAYPNPLPGSGQCRYQNWELFFADRDIENRADESKETPDQRARRLTRLCKFAVSGHAPPQNDNNDSSEEAIHKLAFFEWVASEREGFLLRKPISFSDAYAAWSRFKPSQRLYDPHHHEVDLCAMLDSSDQAQNDDAPLDISFADNPITQDTQVPEYGADEPQLVKGRDPVIPEPTAEELSTIISLSDRIVARRDRRLDSLLDGLGWVQWRFGFHFPSGTPPNVRFNWRKGLSAGMINTGDIHPLDSFIADFGQRLTVRDDNNSPTRHSISCYADIFPDHPSYLEPSTSPLGVEKIVLRQQSKAMIAYRLFPEEESSEHDFPWMFVVEEASSVVLAIRHGWGRSRDFLTAKFMEHSIPFHTLALKHPNPYEQPITLPDLVRPLPVREQQAVFMDYANYEASREEFFSGPRGRAIVRYGGVLRRLYNADRLQAQYRLRQVISGPTQLAHIIGDVYTCDLNGEQMTLCEDALTEGEMAFACGQYCARRDMAPECKETWYAPFSFSVKYHFGGNGGIWNNHDEILYHHRREKILQHDSVPLSVSKWKDSSKPNRVAHAGEVNYEAMCIEYLDEYTRIQTTRGTRPRYADAKVMDSFIPMSRS